MSNRLSKIIIVLGAVIISGSVFMIYSKERPRPQAPEQNPPLKISPKPSYYKQRDATMVKSFDVDAKGGIFEIGDMGTPIDNTVIEIPEGALDKKITLSVGYLNDGEFIYHGSMGDGVIMVLSTKSVINFKKTAKIKIRLDSPRAPKTIGGFSIGERDDIHLIPGAGINKKTGEGVIPFSRTPLVFTWVSIYYAENLF